MGDLQSNLDILKSNTKVDVLRIKITPRTLNPNLAIFSSECVLNTDLEIKAMVKFKVAVELSVPNPTSFVYVF